MKRGGLLAAGVALLSACDTTGLRVRLSLAEDDRTAAPLELRFFDSHRAILPTQDLGTPLLPGVFVAYGLPTDDLELRVVAARTLGAVTQWGAQKAVLEPGALRDVNLVIGSLTDGDGDRIPDLVDNCPQTPNPDQQNGDADPAGDACQAPVGGIRLDVTVPTLQSIYYGSHDSAPRTLTFTHDADSVACSHDGGKSFAACQNTFEWTPDDYTKGNEIQIRASKAGLPDKLFTLNPSKTYGMLTLVTCDEVVMGDETNPQFQARIDRPNKAICLGPNVRIRNTGTDSGIYIPQFTRDGTKIVGTEGSRAVFDHSLCTAMDRELFSDSGKNTVLANVSLLAAGVDQNVHTVGIYLHYSNTISYVDVKSNSSYGTGIEIVGAATLYNVTASNAADNGAVLHLHQFNSEPVPVVTLLRSRLSASADVQLLYLEQGSIAVQDSELDSPNAATIPTARLTGGMATFKNTRIASGNVQAVQVATGANVTFEDARLEGATFGVTVVNATASLTRTVVTTRGSGVRGDGSTLALTDSIIQRLDYLPAGGVGISFMNANTLSGTGNRFCNRALTGANRFTAAISGAFTGSYMPSAQLNGGMVDVCP